MRPSQIRNLVVFGVLAAIALWASSTAADFIIEYNWWKEIGQVSTWVGMLWYSIAPAAAGSLVAFIALWVAHARGLHFSGILKRDHPIYSRLVPVGLAIVAILFSSSSIDYWTVMRFFGSRGLTAPADAWKDQVFSRGLPFYLFDLPFYAQVLGFVFVLAILCALVFWITARGWQLADRFRYGAAGWRAAQDSDYRAGFIAAAGRDSRRFCAHPHRHYAARLCRLDLSRQL